MISPENFSISGFAFPAKKVCPRLRISLLLRVTAVPTKLTSGSKVSPPIVAQVIGCSVPSKSKFLKLLLDKVDRPTG